MKKWFNILLLFLVIANVFNIIYFYTHTDNFLFSCSGSRFINNSDTSINHIRIDSIELVIRYQDSIINKIKVNEIYEIEKINAYSDTASVELFKRLVSE